MAPDASDRDDAIDLLLLPPQARRFLRNGQSGTTAVFESGAVLYCDLSGFSRMGAEAIARSERGAEDLRTEINGIFDLVSRAIEGGGGYLLYYAGDAVAAIWPGADDPAKAVRAAAAAGRNVQREIDGLGAGLSMRAGVTFGGLWLLDIAMSSDGRMPVFCGEVLEEIAGLDLLPDGVTLSPKALALTSDDDVASAGAGTSLSESLAEAAPCAQIDASEWLRPHHRTGLAQGVDWLAEFRGAYVLFARLFCPPVRSEEDAFACADALRSAAVTVEAEGGTLLQICQDDKGLVLVAAWGLASSAWEDSAERAVLAAQGIAGVGGHAAVAGGKVFAGLVGARMYQQYVVVGDAINRAAGMSVLAPAPVILDEATAGAAARRFETEPVARLPLKGRTETVAVHAVRRERLRGLVHAGTLVGRNEEKAWLRDFADRVARGEQSDLAIFGEAGQGKSRLAGWLQERLSDAGTPNLSIKGDGIRRAIGFTPVAPLVRDLLGLPADADSETCRRALEIMEDEEAPWLPLLNPVLPSELAETPETRALTGAGRAERTRDLMTRLLAHLLPRHGVLIVDDAHWLDSATWQLLDSLTRAGDLSLVLLARPMGPDDLPSEARRFLDPDRVDTIRLGPLPEDEAGALAAQALGATETSPPLAAFLHRKASGHPLFTIALAQTLAARGVVRVEAGFAHLRLGEEGLSGLSIPSDAAVAVAERIAALSPAQQLTVKTTSVLGRNFDEEAVAELHPSAGVDEVLADLQLIEKTGLVERLDTGGWRFHHAIVADAAYASLTSQQAKELHARAVKRIARRAGEEPAQSDRVLLAHHAERAGDAELALLHLTAASANARAAYANLEVVEFLTRAIALAGAGADALTLARWRYDIAHALRALGQYQRAEDFLKMCISGLDRAPPETGGQAIRGLLGGYAGFRLRPARAQQPDETRAPIILAADATMMLSEIHYELNKIPFALAEILRGANLARRAGGGSATLAKLYIGMSLISTSLPWALDGDVLQEQALDIASRLDDPATEAWVLMVSGNYESGKAGWTRGAEHFLRSMEIAEAVGERKT
ncbi:AAA family ATPase, partial [Cribrihabitans sp. XS_ASV171]